MSNGTAKQTQKPEQQIPRIFHDALGMISGGRVLDVATGVGNFVHFLLGCLADVESIVGIDRMDALVTRAREAFDDEGVEFRTMDAASMIFEDDSFDTVSIMASLHHFEDIDAVMSEVRRVLRPGGTLIIAEMHGDGSSAAAQTGVDLHRWAASVDSARGRFHGQTMSRDDVLALIRGWDWQKLTIHEWVEEAVQQMGDAELQHLDGMIDMFIDQARGFGADEALIAEGETLRARLRSPGLGQQPFVIAVGVPA